MSEVRDVVAAASQLTDAEFLEVVRAVAAGRPGLGALLAAVDVGAAVPAEDPVTAEVVPHFAPGVPEPDYTAGGVPEPDYTAGGVPEPDYTAGGVPEPDYTAGGVPTFDRVRDRIENRFGTAMGSSELAHESPSGQSLDEAWEAREKAGKAKLDEIRRSLGKQ
ncbi:hypothetical protein [Rhodococcus jostii]|uniref:Uncharacterized protein n=1 Tax=Rhodococcus jostii TaxID=132919 RepID=A0A1H4UJ61_RHOJO|nr:hypothetical protein [Rhodococcus jostii]SEC68448.1 hypothetical protein SAMN04490220_2302 [Rhodococcus jostii]